MAELVDAPASGAGVLRDVEVQVLSRAPLTFLYNIRSIQIHLGGNYAIIKHMFSILGDIDE